MKKYLLDELIFFVLGLFAFSVIFSVTAVEAALFLLLGLLLVKMRREGTLAAAGPAQTSHPLFVPWMVYLGVCLLTALTAYYPAKGLGQLNSDFLRYLCLYTLLFAVKKEHLPRLSLVYVSAAFLAAVIGLAEVARGAFEGGPVLPRANAFMNAVRYSEVMTLALTLILSRLILPVPETFRRERLFYALSAAAVFAAVILSQTRGAYLGLAVMTITMFYFAGAARKKMAVFAAAMFAATFLLTAVNPAMRGRLTAVAEAKPGDFSPNSPSTGINVRLELWNVGYKMLRAHPILGVGPDNIKRVFKKFHPEPFPEKGIYGTLNNLYVQQAAERGLPGLAALLLLFGSFFAFALKRFKAAQSPYTLWALCALPAYYAMNLTEITFQHVHTAFAVMLALAFSAAAEEGKL